MQVLSCEIFENFKNTYFEENLQTTAPERLRKIACIRKTVVIQQTTQLSNKYFLLKI